MTRLPLAAAFMMAATLSACGGGGGGSASATVAVAATTYLYAPPQAGAQSVYADTLVDNRANTINRNLVVDVTAVTAAGYTATEADPTHDRVVSGAVDHTFYPTTYTYDAAGRATAWTVIGASGTPVQCLVGGGQLAGAPSPLTVGQAWSATYTEACGGNAGRTYTQTGSFVGIESVTVPAGTFSADKFVSTTTWTSNGLMTTETVTRWRDAAAAGSRVLKSISTFSYSGAEPPQGALVSETQSLQSFH